jgi:hypothetical protein
MTSRAFTYNPTEVAVTGTILHGNLLIQEDPLDYSSKPGNFVWWQGPDEDLGYVIATTFPAGTRSTPVGNVGTVRFWRTQAFDDVQFINLANTVTGQSFLDTASAVTWLHANSYWTSYSTTYSLVSLYEARNQSSYPSPYDGSTWFDLSAENNDASLTNTSFDIEMFSMYFNTAYASIGQPISGNQYSIVAWITPFATNGAHNIVSSQNNVFWINSGTLYGGVGGSYTLVSESGINDSQRYFVALTFNGDTNTMTLYVDGSQVDQNTNVTQNYTPENTFIGSHYVGSNVSFFEGLIDYVAIYEGELSASTVSSIYTNTYSAYVN